MGRNGARRSPSASSTATCSPGACSTCSRRWRADRPLLLRGQHERPRLAARLPRRDRAHPPAGGLVRGARARQRLRRRLGRGGARGLSGGAADRAGAPRRARPRTTRACCARRAGRYCLLLNEDTELRDGRDARAARRARGRPARRRGRRAAADQRRRPDRLRLAAARRRLGAGAARSSSTPATRCRAAATTCAGSAGCSRARCWCAARPRSRWTGSTPPSSSTRTRPTSAGGCTTPAGGSCSCPQRARRAPRPALDRRGRHAAPHRGVPPRPRPLLPQAPHAAHARALARLLDWAYLVRAAAATVLPGHSPRRYLLHARQQLNPAHGEGLREVAEAYNRRARRRPRRQALTLPRRWSTLTSPNSPRSAARSARCSCCSRAGALALLAGLVLLAARRGRAGAVARRRVARQALQRRRRRGGRGRAAACSAARRRAARAPAGAGCRSPSWRPPRSGRRSRFDSSNRFLVSIAEDGRLGRLLPLYFVLAAAAAGARLARAARRSRCGALPRVIALPAAAFFALRLPVAALGRRPRGRRPTCSRSSRCPFAALLAMVARADYPDWVPRALAAVGSRWRRCSPPWASTRRHPRAVLLRAQPRRLEREHGLLPRHLAVRRPEPLRAPRGARRSAWRSRCSPPAAGARGR